MPAYTLNEHVSATSLPPIPLAGQWAAAYDDAHGLLINLAQGVPGSAPPQELLNRLSDAARLPETVKYGDLRGDIELRRALVADLNALYDGDVTTDECTMTAGCNMAFYAAIMALAKAGDEVILPCPWYFNHEMSLTTLGVKATPLACHAPAFLPSVDECDALITEKTRAIALVTPNNPTGAIYSPDLLSRFADLARRRQVALIVDETYRDFLPAGERPHSLFNDSEWRQSVIHLYSFSKAYAVPGARLGAIIAPAALQENVHKLMDCIQICPARAPQGPIAWAVEGIRSWREQVRDELIDRAHAFKECMREAPDWQVDTIGGYFAYVRHPFGDKTSQEVAQALAARFGLVVLPGSFFQPPLMTRRQDGDDRHLRFSIANVDKQVLSRVPGRLLSLQREWKAS